MTNAVLRGKPYAGNPHVRFDEGEVASGKPRRGSLLYNKLGKFIAACVAAAVCFDVSAFTSSSYKGQDALIAQWDGIENAGRGVHDASAATWVDLTGNGYDFPVQAYMGSQLKEWSTNSLVAKSCYQVPCAKSCSDYVTIEICAKHNGQYKCLFNSGDGLKKFVAVKNTTVQFYNASNNNYDIGSGDSFQAAAVHASDGTLVGVYTNGAPAAQTASDTWVGNNNGTCLGRGANSYQFTGEYYAIRLYNRALTADEIAYNAKVDAARYFGAVYSDTLEVTGTPIEIDGVSPANGSVEGLAVGVTLPCTAPAVWTNVEETIAATCTGYKVYTNDVVCMEGNGNSFTYVHPDCESGARLVWQWGVEYKVSVAAAAGLTVTAPPQFVAHGGVVEFPVACDDGRAVASVQGGVYRDGKIIVSNVTAPVEVVVSMGNAKYVATDGNDTAGDGSYAMPFATLTKALSVAQGGDTVILKRGTYETADEITVSAGATIRGETGNPEDVVIKASGSHRMFTLNHADAKLAGLTISGGTRTGTSDAGAGVYITAAGGTVEKCVVRNCSSNGSFAYGAGICVAAKSPGLVDSCVISNCAGQANGHFHGGLALALDGGEARNCLITGNSLTIRFDDGNRYDIGAVRVDGGRLVNCTVAGNACSRTPGVVATKGTVENCIIAENVRTDATDAKLVTWSGDANCFINCVGTDKINDKCFAEAHPFVNSAAGNFAPLLGGAAVDASVAADWMAGAKDVLGNPRVSGSASDIGAIEYGQTEFSACVRPSVTCGKAPLDVTFAVAAAGASGNVTYSWNWGDGSASETTGGLSATHRFAEPGVYNVQLTVSDAASSYTVPQVLKITAFGDEVRVVKDNLNAAIPYDTWANAAATLEDAYAFAEDGCEIVISNGIYSTAAEIAVIKGVTIRSLTGDPADVTIQASGTHRMFTLGDRNAKFSGLTIAGGKVSSYYEGGGGIRIVEAGGTVERCVISNCQCTTSYNYGGGIAIVANAPALVDSCVIRNCESTTSHFSGGIAIRLDGGEARNCLLVDNSMTVAFSTAQDGGTVYLNGGKLVNCTVAGNTCSRCPGVVAVNGTAENCLIAENTSTAATDAKTISWSGTESCFTNCVASDKINDWCAAELHPFVNFNGGDYAPALGTAAIDASTRKDWMTEDAKDVLGNGRVSGGTPDIGAVEYDQSRFSVSFGAKVLSGRAPLDVVFTVTPVGATDGITCYWDWDGDGNADEETDGSVTHTFLTPTYSGVRLSVKNNATGEVIAVPQTVNITVFGDEVRVVKDNPNAAIPYDNWANAAATVAEAYDFAEDGCEIVISNGTHAMAAEINVLKSVTIRGSTGDPADVILQAVGTHRHFILANAGAKLSGLTLSSGTTPGHYERGGAVKITAVGGTVEKCVICDCRSSGSYGYGVGAYIETGSPGLIDSCVFRGCRSDNANFKGGQALALDGGEARNCLFVGNSPTLAALDNDCGTVYLNGGKLSYCTVTGNSSAKCPGVVALKGTVENCLIAENVGTGATDAKTVTWAGSASCFVNCVGTDKINDSCAAEAHPFVNFAAGDYAPALGTAAIDRGVLQSWMVEGAKDLLGNVRVSGSAPDIGAIEYDQSQFSASFKANVLSGKAPLDVAFTVTSVGATGGISCYWDWNGDGNADETTNGSTTHRFADPGVYNVLLSVQDESGKPVLEVPQVVKITAFGERICVVTDNPNAAAPYDNWDNAASSLADAYDLAEDGCEIVVASGTHAIPTEINVVKAVTIRSQTGNAADVVLQATSGNHRLFRLGNVGAKISAVTLSGGTTPGHWEDGGCVKITSGGGTVEKCVICNYKSGGSFCEGLGAYIEANSPGLIDSCVISNCVSSSGNLDGGIAMSLAGGEARNCLITGNSPTGAFDNDCGSVYLTGGRLVNCTVAGNSLSKCPGVVAKGGTVVNCIISENTCTAAGATPAMATWAGTASCFDHCISTEKINDSCFVGENLFRDSANGDYRLVKGAAALDKGIKEEWMADPDGKDFFGGRRVSNLIPDLGYHELQVGGFFLIVR